MIEDAMSVAVQKWTEFESILANTSWTMEDEMTVMAGGPAAEEKKGSQTCACRVVFQKM